MINRHILRSLLLLLALTPVASHAQAPRYAVVHIRYNHTPVALDSAWRYHPGDDPAWASPAYNDSSWAARKTRFGRIGSRNAVRDSFPEVGWFRQGLTFDTALVGQAMAIDLSQLTAAVDIFFDGQLLRRPDTVGLHEAASLLQMPLIFEVPDAGPHLLAIRLRDSNVVRDKGGHVIIGGFSASIHTAAGAMLVHESRTVVIASASVFVSAFFFAFTLLHLIVFLYYRRGRSHLWFAAFCLGLSFFSFAIYLSLSMNVHSVDKWLEDYGILVIALTCAALSAFVNHLFGWGRMRNRLAQIVVAAGVLGLFVDFVAERILPLLSALVFIEAIVLIIRAIFRRVPGARIIGGGLMLFGVMVITIAFMALMGPEVSLNIADAAGQLIGIGIVVAIISIPLSMSAYLAWSYATVTRRLSRELTEVERLSAEALEHEVEKQQLLTTRAEELEHQVGIRTEELRGQKEKSDELLRNILPDEVAAELKEKGSSAARLYDNVTVLFTDFADFTQMAETLSPAGLVAELDQCFSAFDEIVTRHGLEKIKTVGDAYIAVSGLPAANDRHAQAVVAAALEIRAYMLARKASHPATFRIRLGVHSGPVVAGIVGVKKFAYDIWGDTVNTAARMEQHSEAGRLNISEATYSFVKDEFACSYRGEIEAKHKGRLGMYFVECEAVEWTAED